MKNKKKLILVILLVLFLLAAALGVVFGKRGTDEKQASDPTEGQSEELTTEESWVYDEPYEVSGVFSYSGPYVEDGSDEPVENIAAIRITNHGKYALQTVTYEVYGEERLFFFATGVLPGDTVTVLEYKKTPFKEGTDYGEPVLSECSNYTVEPSLNADKFEITRMGSVINLKNISDKNMKYDVYLYYKNKNAEGYLGGITYRVNFGALKAGELAQRSSAHFSDENSEILFITYGE